MNTHATDKRLEACIVADFGLSTGELHLVKVGPEWAQRFSGERDRISAALGEGALDIQHVGSTAVPEMLAKPILDIAVAIASFEEGDALVPLLEALGYHYRGEYGIARRHYFFQGDPQRTHHLHMLEQRGAAWAGHVRFRDRLLASPALAARYSDLKMASIAESSGSRDRYQALKASFIVEANVPEPAHPFPPIARGGQDQPRS